MIDNLYKVRLSKGEPELMGVSEMPSEGTVLHIRLLKKVIQDIKQCMKAMEDPDVRYPWEEQ